MSKKLIIQSGSEQSGQPPQLTGTIKSGERVVFQQGQPQQQDADVTFVVDTTGSMNDKIEALLQTCSKFVTDFSSLGMNARFCVIAFGDIKVVGGGDTIEVVTPLTSDIEQVKKALRNMPKNSGFANVGESSLEALDLAMKQDYRKSAVKVIVLITDDYAHQDNITATSMIQQLRQREFLVFVIALETPYYSAMATENGGTWTEISADSKLSDLLELFRRIASKISQTTKEVHVLGSGSVAKYLALNPPKKS